MFSKGERYLLSNQANRVLHLQPPSAEAKTSSSSDYEESMAQESSQFYSRLLAGTSLKENGPKESINSESQLEIGFDGVSKRRRRKNMVGHDRAQFIGFSNKVHVVQ